MKWSRLILFALSGVVLSFRPSTAFGQPTNSETAALAALQAEVDQLRQGQRVIESQLQEITKLLSANAPSAAAAPRPNPAIGATVNIAGKPVRGDKNARLTLVEFADYECPYCGRQFRDTDPQILKDYVQTGKLKYVFSDLPLPMHAHARKAAEAALCAGDQGKYWEMHDLLYANQRSLDRSNLVSYAAALGLNMPAFEAALDSGKHAAEVQAAATEAGGLGLNGAPSFVLGLTEPGDSAIKVLQVIVGAQPYAAFQKDIAEALNPAANPAQPVAPETPGIGQTVSVAGKQFKGSKDAKLTVIEYSDYECSFCAREALETYPQLEKDYVTSGKVKYVYGDLVLDNIHPHATKAAEASWCAGAQGKYWEMHDVLFANTEALDETNLVSYAAMLGLDTGAFQQCLDSGQFAAQVKTASLETRRLGLNNTPTCAIGLTEPDSPNVKILKVIVGAQGYPALKSAIESILNPVLPPVIAGPAAGSTLSVAGRPFKGDDHARVTLVAFADYQCPSCERYFQNTEPQILKNYVATGKLKYVFSDLPLRVHHQSERAAEAALCAGDQGKYWEMHDLMYSNQAAIASGNFSGYARAAGLDLTAFQSCLESKRFVQQVYSSFAQAQHSNLNGTPSFIIGLSQSGSSNITVQKVIVGAKSYDVFQAALDSVLNSATALSGSSASAASQKL